MGWDNSCQACGRHRNSCICTGRREDRGPMKAVAPEAPYGNVPDEDIRRVRRARKDFVRRVEDAIESGDQRDIDKRIGRYIEDVSQ